MRKSILTCAVSLAFMGIAPQALAADVDCSTAEADIAHLEHEKKSTDERQVKGVMSIMPIGLAINAVGEAADSGSSKEMDIKEYNQKLTDRINEIKQACGM